MDIKKIFIFIIFSGALLPAFSMWHNTKNFFNRRMLFGTAAVATTAGTAGLLGYKYPTWFEYCKNKYADLRFNLAQGKKTSPQERERVRKLLDEHSGDIRMMFHDGKPTKEQQEKAGALYVAKRADVLEFSWLPGYLIKKDITRIEGAEAIEDCIEEHKLRHVGVAEKWLHDSPEQKPFVVVKKVEHAEGRPITLNQVKDLCCVLKNAKYRNHRYHDAHSGNLFNTHDGRLVFIDTASNGFSNYFAGMAFIHLDKQIDDENTREYLMKEFAEDDPRRFVNYVLRGRTWRLYEAMQKLGYEKTDAQNEIKKNIKKHFPLLDAVGVAAYEDTINTLDSCQKYEKQNPEKLTAKQRICIDQFLNEKRISKKNYDEYDQCIRE